MLRKRVAVLVAAAMLVLTMLAAAPAFAQGQGFAQGVGGSDPNPGESEGSSSPLGTPPQAKPGTGIRDPIANEQDQHDTRTGFGHRVGLDA